MARFANKYRNEKDRLDGHQRQAGSNMTAITGRKAPIFGCILAAVTGLSGCATDVPYRFPEFPFRSNYSAANQAVPVLLNNAQWWRGFKDPVLDSLVARALTSSLDLELARERVIEARANLDAVPLSGSITPSASFQRERDLSGVTQTRSEGGLGLSWMLDPYGARRQQVKAAGARLEVADAEVDAARLLLIFNIANAYIDLRHNQRILQLRREQLRSRRQTAALTQRLFDQNSATRLDVVRTDALVAETQAQIPLLISGIHGNKNEIAVLSGARPNDLDVNLDRGRGQPRPGVSPEVGIPTDLLRNRPDIRIAERLYNASVADIGVARAALYPRLSLGGSISLVSSSGISGTEYVFGPTLQFPSLLNGDRKAGVRARHSRARQAHTSWKSAVLGAVAEVESALASYGGTATAVQASHRSARLYREAAELTRDLLERDVATVRDLIDAEGEIADADVIHADNLRRLARDFVMLNVSIGAGHNVGEPQQPLEVAAVEPTE